MAETREKSKQKKSEFWNGHIQRQQQSGKSIMKYCQEYELGYSAFMFWKNKLKAEHSGRASQKSPEFVRVKIQEPVMQQRMAVDPEWLARVAVAAWKAQHEGA